MNISRVNMGTQAFKAQTENDYNKTNAGKFLGLGCGIGYTAEHIRSKGGWIGFCDDARKSFANSLNASVKTPVDSKAVVEMFSSEKLTPGFIKKAYLMKIALMTGIVAGCILAGSIIDLAINSGKRHSAG